MLPPLGDFVPQWITPCYSGVRVWSWRVVRLLVQWVGVVALGSVGLWGLLLTQSLEGW